MFTARYGLGVYIYNSTFCPHTVFMCFVWISEQTAIISQYSINWLVCITETECVYCAVRTGSIYNSTFCPHSVFTCFAWISEQTAIISLYSIDWLIRLVFEPALCIRCWGRTSSGILLWLRNSEDEGISMLYSTGNHSFRDTTSCQNPETSIIQDTSYFVKSNGCCFILYIFCTWHTSYLLYMISTDRQSRCCAIL